MNVSCTASLGDICSIQNKLYSFFIISSHLTSRCHLLVWFIFNSTGYLCSTTLYSPIYELCCQPHGNIDPHVVRALSPHAAASKTFFTSSSTGSCIYQWSSTVMCIDFFLIVSFSMHSSRQRFSSLPPISPSSKKPPASSSCHRRLQLTLAVLPSNSHKGCLTWYSAQPAVKHRRVEVSSSQAQPRHFPIKGYRSRCFYCWSFKNRCRFASSVVQVLSCKTAK